MEPYICACTLFDVNATKAIKNDYVWLLEQLLGIGTATYTPHPKIRNLHIFGSFPTSSNPSSSPTSSPS